MEKPAKTIDPQSANNNVSFGNLLLACLITCILTLSVTYFFVKHAFLQGKWSTQSEVLTVDVDSLLNAQMNALLSSNLTKTEIQEQSVNFSKNLAAILGEYQDQGKVVLVKDAVVAIPAAQNITDTLASKLVLKNIKK